MSRIAGRSQALDVMRGLTLALMIVVNMSIGEKSYAPLLHAAWSGLTLTDLVFPTFLFVVGAALSYTLDRYQHAGSAAVARKVLTRTTVIFACGFLLYWFPFFQVTPAGDLALLPISHTRIMGVLQRIALSYGAAALMLHFGGRRFAVAFGISALLGYWWILHAFGDYTLAGNAVLKLDRLVLGDEHLYRGEGVPFDPEGILSTLPAIVNVLAGYFAGRLVRERGASYETIALLLLAAAPLVVGALWWDPVFPINKKLWTSSYVLCTIGVDLTVLAALVYLIDLRLLRGWTRFFEAFGRNTLVIYLFSEVVDTLLGGIHVGRQSLFEWIYQAWFEGWAGSKPGALLYALAAMLLCWFVADALDRRKIYIRA